MIPAMVRTAGSRSRGLPASGRLRNALRAGGLLVAAWLCSGSCAAPVASSLATPAPAPDRVHLAWHAPYGTPGAADTLRTPCDDHERVDTLYVSAFTARDLPNVIAMSATLRFAAEAPDSLGPFWEFKSGRVNERSMFIDFDLGSAVPCPQPWRVVGSGAVRYDLAGARSELQLEYAIPSEHSIPMTPEAQNCLARIRIFEKRNQLSGCAQPVRAWVERVRFELLDGTTLDLGSEASNSAFWNPRAGMSPAGPGD